MHQTNVTRNHPFRVYDRTDGRHKQLTIVGHVANNMFGTSPASTSAGLRPSCKSAINTIWISPPAHSTLWISPPAPSACPTLSLRLMYVAGLYGFLQYPQRRTTVRFRAGRAQDGDPSLRRICGGWPPWGCSGHGV